MKIGYLIPEWPGQSHVWAWREISHLRELGLDVTIISTRKPKELGKHDFAVAAEAETVYLWPIPVHKMAMDLVWAAFCYPLGFLSCLRLCFTLPLDQPASWRSLLPLVLPACQLSQVIRHTGIDHLHTPMPANAVILCMMAKRILGVPFSITVCAPFEHWGGGMQEKFAEATFVTVVAQWMLEHMERDFPAISPERRFITRHGVDTQKWSPDPNKRASDPSRKQILSIGRLAHTKGFDVLLQSLAIVKSQGISFQLKIAGEGLERPHLETLIRDLDLVADIELLGSVSEEDCLAAMQASDLFVSASRAEGFSVARQESMAAEVATIGTEIEGANELIEHGVNGLLVPPEQAEPLAAAISLLLSHDELRQQLAKAGRQTMLEKFDSRVGAAKLRDLLLHSQRFQPKLSPNQNAGQAIAHQASRIATVKS